MDEVKNIDKRDNLRVTTSNAFISARGLSKLSLKAKKLLYIAITQCKKNDKEFYTHEISAKEFAALMDISPNSVYEESDRLTDELLRGILEVKHKGEKNYKKYSLFSLCQYEDGVIRFKLNPDMTEFFLELQGDFSKPLLQDFLKMKSGYSISIWHMMQREMHSAKPKTTDSIIFDLSLEELRDVTDTGNTYPQISEFKKNCFDLALKEIKQCCGVTVSYTNIKSGRSIIGFHCKVVSNFHIDESKIPQNVKDQARFNSLKAYSKEGILSSQEQKEYLELKRKFEDTQIELSF